MAYAASGCKRGRRKKLGVGDAGARIGERGPPEPSPTAWSVVRPAFWVSSWRRGVLARPVRGRAPTSRATAGSATRAPGARSPIHFFAPSRRARGARSTSSRPADGRAEPDPLLRAQPTGARSPIHFFAPSRRARGARLTSACSGNAHLNSTSWWRQQVTAVPPSRASLPCSADRSVVVGPRTTIERRCPVTGPRDERTDPIVQRAEC